MAKNKSQNRSQPQKPGQAERAQRPNQGGKDAADAQQGSPADVARKDRKQSFGHN